MNVFFAKICNSVCMEKQEDIDYKAKREFLVALIHDLKNPIIAQEKMIEMFLDMPENTPISDLKEILTASAQSNKEILKMLDDFLSIYHCEMSAFQVTLESVNLKTIIKEILVNFQYLLKEKNLKLNLNIKKNTPEINGGKLELKRVLTNFIANAINNSPNNSEITLELKKIENKIFFKISNQCEECSKIEKDSFFNLYKTAKNKIGHGLGLFISKKIIELHKGTVGVESEKENEISFYFYLPVNLKN